MTTIFVCDGCGKQEEPKHSNFSPALWYETHPDKSKWNFVLHACSRPCIELASKKYKVSDLVLPI